jgi:hypothetical protein
MLIESSGILKSAEFTVAHVFAQGGRWGGSGRPRQPIRATREGWALHTAFMKRTAFCMGCYSLNNEQYAQVPNHLIYDRALSRDTSAGLA